MASVASEELVEPIRKASRRLVRELSFVDDASADAGHSTAAIQVLIEIGDNSGVTVTHLSTTLGLDRSRIRAIVRELVAAGEVVESEDSTDSDQHTLGLTAKGSELCVRTTESARDRVLKSLSHIQTHDAQAILYGLQTYTSSLHVQRIGQMVNPLRDVHITRGYRPGLIARTLQMHMDEYSRTVGFGAPYEQSFASNLSEMVSRLNHERNGVWTAVLDGKIIGTLYIVGQDVEDNVARLRAFIVDDELRGSGIGRRLLTEAVSFIEKQGFDGTQLWTFQGSDAARHLYESVGFVLKEEHPGKEWFDYLTVQLFVRESGGVTKTAKSTPASV